MNSGSSGGNGVLDWSLCFSIGIGHVYICVEIIIMMLVCFCCM